MATVISPFEALTIIHGTFIEQNIQISLYTLLVYDLLITYDKEIEYLWTRRWHNLTHILFFFNRYVGIIATPAAIIYRSLNTTTRLCKFSTWTFNIGGIFSVIAIDYILVIRVLALWNNNRLLSMLLKAMIVGEVITKFVVIVKVKIIEDEQAVALIKGISICGSGTNLAQAYKLTRIDWSIQLSVACILFILAIFKSSEHWRSLGYTRSNLNYIVIRDQIIYYIAVLFCSNMGIISLRASTNGSSAGPGYYILTAFANPNVLCLLGSRMFINLIEAGQSDIKNGSVTDVQSSRGSAVSEIQFGDPSGHRSVDNNLTGPQITYDTVSEIEFVDGEDCGTLLDYNTS